MDEQKDKETKTEGTKDDSGEGDESEISKQTKQLRIGTERLNKAIAENEEAKAKAKLGGVTEITPKEEKKTDDPPEADQSKTGK